MTLSVEQTLNVLLEDLEDLSEYFKQMKMCLSPSKEMQESKPYVKRFSESPSLKSCKEPTTSAYPNLCKAKDGKIVSYTDNSTNVWSGLEELAQANPMSKTSTADSKRYSLVDLDKALDKAYDDGFRNGVELGSELGSYRANQSRC